VLRNLIENIGFVRIGIGIFKRKKLPKLVFFTTNMKTSINVFFAVSDFIRQHKIRGLIMYSVVQLVLSYF